MQIKLRASTHLLNATKYGQWEHSHTHIVEMMVCMVELKVPLQADVMYVGTFLSDLPHKLPVMHHDSDSLT